MNYIEKNRRVKGDSEEDEYYFKKIGRKVVEKRIR
jgi:hypothetical protein